MDSYIIKYSRSIINVYSPLSQLYEEEEHTFMIFREYPIITRNYNMLKKINFVIHVTSFQPNPLLKNT